MNFSDARRLIQRAVANGTASAAVVEVGRADAPRWSEAFGRLRQSAGAPHTSTQTVFDLASLTKVIATASLVQRELTRRPCSIDTPVCEWLPEWNDGGAIRLRDLLDHSSGLPAHDRFWVTGLRGRHDYLRALEGVARQRPRTSAVYSDLGFILLGFALERRAGQPLDAQFRELASDSRLGDVSYVPPTAWQSRTAATEFDPWRGRLLVGEVHDENAWALDGVAGHSGLFGTADAVGRFARAVIQSFTRDTPFSTPPLARLFATRGDVPSSSRGLGWDTMLPTSSCGQLMSPTAIGHTGFTGTSLWIDWERDLYVVLLTNRVHPTRDNAGIQQLRPALHDTIMREFLE